MMFPAKVANEIPTNVMLKILVAASVIVRINSAVTIEAILKNKIVLA